ncbi:MAG: DNA polymerase ligase N-terminal domain-containing protein [Desulfomonilaceae bacterium]
MTKKEFLKAYRENRDFRRTSEPKGDTTRAERGEPIFVIHKHKARNLHYDFRLEAEGVLKSWAIPKGPSTDPKIKRLAVATEDHPLEYAEFEGVIRKGEYGGGVVLVWDCGTYRNITEDKGRRVTVEAAIERGGLSVWLEGKKLKGGYSFIRFRGESQNQWLLVKMNDDHADSRNGLLAAEPDSVLSGRSLEDIEADETPTDS